MRPPSEDEGKLAERLGYRFTDVEILRRSLTHRSRLHETGGPPTESYERLEFLGDALLGFLVSEALLKNDSEASEGVLTRRKQLVVRTETLARAARRVGLGDALRLGRGEETTGGREKPSLLADVFEAVLAAIYLDGGIRPARAYVRRQLKQVIQEARLTDFVTEDYKTRLQETVQAESGRTPRYRVVATHGPAHDRRFEVEVEVNGAVKGSGKGTSRKQAEQEAARGAVNQLHEEDQRGRGGC